MGTHINMKENISGNLHIIAEITTFECCINTRMILLHFPKKIFYDYVNHINS